MKALSAAFWIARNELRIEFRTGEILVTTTLFATLIVVLASLSFYIDPITAVRTAPGVLWISIAFSGVLSMGRSWAREQEHEVLRALLLSPAPRSSLYFAKLASSLIFLLLVECVITPMVALLFHVDLGDRWASLLSLLFLGTLGFAAAGTLFAALSARSQVRELLLSVALFPLIAPSLLAGVVATRELLEGAGPPELMGWLRILATFALLCLVAGSLLFDTLTSD